MLEGSRDNRCRCGSRRASWAWPRPQACGDPRQPRPRGRFCTLCMAREVPLGPEGYYGFKTRWCLCPLRRKRLPHYHSLLGHPLSPGSGPRPHLTLMSAPSSPVALVAMVPRGEDRQKSGFRASGNGAHTVLEHHGQSLLLKSWTWKGNGRSRT